MREEGKPRRRSPSPVGENGEREMRMGKNREERKRERRKREKTDVAMSTGGVHVGPTPGSKPLEDLKRTVLLVEGPPVSGFAVGG